MTILYETWIHYNLHRFVAKAMIFFKSIQAARGQHGGMAVVRSGREPTTRANLKRNLGKYAPVTPCSRGAVSAAGATQEEGEEQGGAH